MSMVRCLSTLSRNKLKLFGMKRSPYSRFGDHGCWVALEHGASQFLMTVLGPRMCSPCWAQIGSQMVSSWVTMMMTWCSSLTSQMGSVLILKSFYFYPNFFSLCTCVCVHVCIHVGVAGTDASVDAHLCASIYWV